MFGASIISFHPAFPFSLHLKILKSVEKVQGKILGFLFLGLIRYRPFSLYLFFSNTENYSLVKISPLISNILILRAQIVDLLIICCTFFEIIPSKIVLVGTCSKATFFPLSISIFRCTRILSLWLLTQKMN